MHQLFCLMYKHGRKSASNNTTRLAPSLFVLSTYAILPSKFQSNKRKDETMKVDFSQIEINSKYVYSLDNRVLKILLKDKTTGKNIIWATSEYAHFGNGYFANDEICITDVEGIASVIKPRVVKSKEEKSTRIRGMAEVFTPSWMCNKQNNLVDNAWFGRENVFNTETGTSWKTNPKKIEFQNIEGKTWQDYVKANRLEISCGEAPYLASRYDTVSGDIISVEDRIGLLDRKLRIVSENVDSEPEWYEWAKKAIQSIYGFDWQGDNILLARENLLFTFIDYYEKKFGVPPIKEYLIQIAKILAWNIFQMDGIKFVVPNSCKDVVTTEETIFGSETITQKCEGCKRNDHSKHNGIYCRTYDWAANESVEFYSAFIKEKHHGKSKL